MERETKEEKHFGSLKNSTTTPKKKVITTFNYYQ